MTADCEFCGRVPVYYKQCRDRYVCRRAKSQWNKKGARRPVTKAPLECEICGGGYKISWDHNHSTGKHRGWICMHCNTALGLVKDNIFILQRMIEYLEK